MFMFIVAIRFFFCFFLSHSLNNDKSYRLTNVALFTFLSDLSWKLFINSRTAIAGAIIGLLLVFTIQRI